MNASPPPLSLTEIEQQWLSEHPEIRLGVGVAFPPFMWVEKDGDAKAFRGMVSDYVNLLAERLGVTMDIVFDITFKEALSRGRSGQIDFFPCLSKTPERSEFLSFTEPYLSYPMVVITREGAPIIGGVKDLNEKRFAVVRHLVIYSKIENDFPDLNLDYVFTQKVDENLDAVSLGRADACIINLAVASYYIQRKGLTNLRIAAPVNWKGVQLSMGVRKDWPVFQGIVTKAIASVSQEEKDRIIQKWIRVRHDLGVNINLIWRWSMRIGFGVVVLFVIVIAWNWSLKSEIRGRKQAENQKERVIRELRKALDEVKTLQGFLPICASCKKIRDDEGYWQKIEGYLQEHSNAQFSHSICPECAKKLYPDFEISHNRQ